LAYNPSVPQGGDLLSQSQSDILNNFTAIKTLVDINHVTFDAVEEGKHHFVQFPVQSPVPTTGAGEVGIYSQTSAITGNPELVFAPENDATTYEFTSATKNANGFTMLPSGIIIKWGTGSVGANTTAVATFNVGSGVPAFTTVYNVQVTRQGTTGESGVLYYESYTTADVTVFNTADSTKTFFYTVIGV